MINALCTMCRREKRSCREDFPHDNFYWDISKIMDPHSDSKDCYLFLITGNGSRFRTRSLYCEFMNLYLKEARKKKAEFEGKDINLEPKVIYKNYGPNRCYRDDVTLVDRTKGTRGGRSLRD
ncbi:hypothetical protein RhiirA1_398067 [Rhizophagus irregularis]|uniref:Uncharacterized protein n=1 Tax=Rhizophagus irregularis TaxID=588596 RepID=A0A2N0RF03_9GLOM|nr:hypothetical protein RhiirA1_398067 [Rhizophagus irregularis]GBC52784.2 hypothetical protein RIR_e54180_A0A2N0RF03_9GLOM [Rhizophagus irregularis DAOM 181602=DAOM 197198]